MYLEDIASVQWFSFVEGACVLAVFKGRALLCVWHNKMMIGIDSMMNACLSSQCRHNKMMVAWWLSSWRPVLFLIHGPERLFDALLRTWVWAKQLYVKMQAPPCLDSLKTLCSPNEDFGRTDEPFVDLSECFSRGSTFQWCEYRIWATKRWKVLPRETHSERSTKGSSRNRPAFQNLRLGGVKFTVSMHTFIL